MLYKNAKPNNLITNKKQEQKSPLAIVYNNAR